MNEKTFWSLMVQAFDIVRENDRDRDTGGERHVFLCHLKDSHYVPFNEVIGDYRYRLRRALERDNISLGGNGFVPDHLKGRVFGLDVIQARREASNVARREWLLKQLEACRAN